MSATKVHWSGASALRDKVALVRCHEWVIGIEARYVRQVGFADLLADSELESDSEFPGHLGRGMIGGAPCSYWDLGMQIGVAPMDRAIIVVERPGGVVALRCGEILAVEAIPENRRRHLPSELAPARPGLIKSALLLASSTEERLNLGWLLRSAAIFNRQEILQVRSDWAGMRSQV
ncbi:MAG: hypothetical protein AB8H80_11430 [Planctomycetota bacterium]